MPDITSLFEGADGVSRTLFNQKLSDINAHGNDATKHVTEKERRKWNIGSVGTCVDGKTTSILADGSIQEEMEDTIEITRFLGNGNIEQIVKSKPENKVLLKKTTEFLADGKIREVVTDYELG